MNEIQMIFRRSWHHPRKYNSFCLISQVHRGNGWGPLLGSYMLVVTLIKLSMPTTWSTMWLMLLVRTLIEVGLRRSITSHRCHLSIISHGRKTIKWNETYCERVVVERISVEDTGLEPCISGDDVLAVNLEAPS